MHKARKNYFTGIVTKYKNIKIHINQVGFAYFLKSKIYDYYITTRLVMKGIRFYKPAEDDLQEDSVTQFDDAVRTLPSSFYLVKEGLQAVSIPNKEICLYDIGCGSGWVLNYGMLLGFKQVAGIERDIVVMKNATHNCNILKNKGYTTTFKIECGDASTTSIPEGTNVIYLFNPFGAETMEKVSAIIINYAMQLSSDLYIIYCLPSYQYFFENEKICKKIYESFNKNKTQAELSVFKLSNSIGTATTY